MKKIAELVPAITVFGTLASLAYCVGYFTYPGREWLSILGLTDVMALAATEAPRMTLALLSGYLIRIIVRKDLNESPTVASSPSTVSSSGNKIDQFTYKYLLIPVYAIWLFSAPFVPSGWAGVYFVVFLGILVFADSAIADTVNGEKLQLVFKIFLVCAVLAAAFSYGQLKSGLIVESKFGNIELDLVTGQKLCAVLVASTQRGPIIFSNSETQLIQWDRLTSIKSSKNCDLGLRRKGSLREKAETAAPSAIQPVLLLEGNAKATETIDTTSTPKSPAPSSPPQSAPSAPQ